MLVSLDVMESVVWAVLSDRQLLRVFTGVQVVSLLAFLADLAAWAPRRFPGVTSLIQVGLLASWAAAGAFRRRALARLRAAGRSASPL